MKSWVGFARSLVFALLCGAASVPWLVIARPLLGDRLALALYATAAATIYVLGISSRRSVGIGAALALLVCAGSLLLLSTSFTPYVIALAGVTASLRSALLWPGPKQSASGLLGHWAREIALTAAGLWLAARLIEGPSAFADSLAIWGFFMVQSGFWLLHPRAIASSTTSNDPFEVTSRHLRAVLDGRI